MDDIEILKRNTEKVKKDLLGVIPLEDMLADDEVRAEIARICERQDERYD